MAAGVVVTCPKCEKKFKPKSDVAGKKIKCPFCSEAFVVPAAKEAKAAKASPEAEKSAKAAAEAQAVPVVAAAPPEDEDNDVNPYGVKTVELVPRCPNCTQEMGEHDTICLACGYNTMTRAWGKTDKTVALTFQRHIIHLAPGIGAAVFAFLSVVFLIYYTVVSPYHVAGDNLLELTDHESMRMWTAVVSLFWLWCAGAFCYKKLIEKPKPDELMIEESSDKPKKPAKA